MKSSLLWETSLVKYAGKTSVSSICYKPDFSQIIAGCANDIFFLDPATGEIEDRKRPHQAPIYCIRCSFDGHFFASSSSDGVVVIWRCSNNDGFIQFGAKDATRSLSWSPIQPLLCACSYKDYHVWQPNDIRAAQYKAAYPIQSSAFSPSGNAFLLSFDNGIVHIIDPSNQNLLQTFSFSIITTSVSFVMINDIEVIVATDLEKKVSLFRASDKALIGKNSLTFDALSSALVGDKEKFFLFAGITGKLCLMTSNLSYLGELETNSDWIWDMDVSKTGQIILARRDGCVEMRTIEFKQASASFGNYGAYRTSINTMTIHNLITNEKISLEFNKIINSLGMNEDNVLVHFDDSVHIYKVNGEKIRELPGKFSHSLLVISDQRIIAAQKKNLVFFGLNGELEARFVFGSNITCLSAAQAFNGGIVTGLEDGSIYFVVKDLLLLYKHDCSVILIRKQNNNVAFIDKNYKLIVFNAFSNTKLLELASVYSFTFNDQIDDLFVASNEEKITIYYKDIEPQTKFIEGTILTMVADKIYISNKGALEVVQCTLPYTQLIENNMWDDIEKLHSNGFTYPNKKLALEAIKHNDLDLAREASDINDKNLSFFLDCFLQDSTIGEDELVEILGMTTPDNIKGESNPEQLEADGISEKALVGYAEKGDWSSVFRLSVSNNLERKIADWKFPKEHSLEASRILLKAGFIDSAIRVLASAKDYKSLACVHISLGQWSEAISLVKLYGNLAQLVYPKFAQFLYESSYKFESAVCLFIVQDGDVREKTIKQFISCAATAKNYEDLSFFHFMYSMNNPEKYWRSMMVSQAYLMAQRINETIMMPINVDNAEELFYLSYFVAAVHRLTPMIGLDFKTILLQLLYASSVLGFKRWVAYSLRELLSYNVEKPLKQAAQLHAITVKESQHQSEIEKIKCPKCSKNIFMSSRVPLIVCGYCGTQLMFSAYSGRLLPLVHVPYSKDDAKELIEEQPMTEEVNPNSTSEFLKQTPPDRFIVQSIKEEAQVSYQIWYNSQQINVHVCRACGTVLDELDFENSALNLDHCPICYTTQITEDSQLNDYNNSDILNMFRSVEESSPFYY